MVELLKQGVYKPLDVLDEVLVIYAGTRGHLDRVPVNKVQEWEKSFLTFMRDQKPEIRRALEDKKDLTDDITKMIEAAIKEFNSQHKFAMSEEEELARV
jgi:F-type H+-transporting ATPase subunit alpha